MRQQEKRCESRLLFDGYMERLSSIIEPFADKWIREIPEVEPTPEPEEQEEEPTE